MAKTLSDGKIEIESGDTLSLYFVCNKFIFAIRTFNVNIISRMIFFRGNFKIFYSIIYFYLIDMMYFFPTFKKTIKMIRHYQSMFHNISIFISHWMFRNPKKLITVNIFSRYANFPSRYFSPRHILNHIFSMNFIRTFFATSFSWGVTTIKNFLTYHTNPFSLFYRKLFKTFSTAKFSPFNSTRSTIKTFLTIKTNNIRHVLNCNLLLRYNQ